MADLNKPVTTDAYADVLQHVRDNVAAVAIGMDPAVVTVTNPPIGALRWSSANGYWEKFNGTTWTALAASYAINISGSASKWTTGRTITLTGDVTGVSGAFDGSGNLSFSTTLATVAAEKGGTGQTAYTVGDILYASTTTALSKLADVATGNALLSGGIGIAPSWGKIGLNTHITGTLALGNGGTGSNTAAGARTALGLVIGTDVMGMGGGTFTGAIAAPNLSGSSSGTNTGDEPAASSTVSGVVELATNTETAAGNDAARAVTPAGLASVGFTKSTMGTNAATTSGTYKDFTGIPAGVNKITIMLSGVSTNSASPAELIIQIGDAGGIETSGYTGAESTSVGTSAITNSNGFTIKTNVLAANRYDGVVTLVRKNGNQWCEFGNVATANTTQVGVSAGAKTLSAELDRLRLTTIDGADTFDAGSINIIYE